MNILIIEDEARIAGRIERISRDVLRGNAGNITIRDSLQEGIDFILAHPIDLLFLDLNLNGEDGFDVLRKVVSESFHTIIISAYKEKAILAFEYGVLDFIPKPFDQARLAQAFQRISNHEKQEEKGLRFLAVKKNGNILLIDINELLYVKGAGIYTELHLKNGRKELHDKSLEKLEQLLPDSFGRIHKSYLVEMAQIQEIIVQSGSKYMILLKNGELLPIGRTRYKLLKEKLFKEL